MTNNRYPKQWIALCTLAMLSASAANSAPILKPVVGVYYTNWAYWRNGGGVKHLEQLDQKPASFINYSFFAPKVSTDAANKPGYGGAPIGPEWAAQPDGTIGDMDNAYESDIARQNYADLLQYKVKNPQTLVIASIGGWSYGPRFHQFAVDANYDATSNAAQNFLNSCEQLLRGNLRLPNKTDYPVFDGLDIDWEFPGFGQGQTVVYPQEFTFYADLMRQLRARVDQVNQEMHTDKVLTVAVPINLRKLNGDGHLDWHQLGTYFDLINLMAFDAHGEFDADTADQAALDQAPADELLAAIDSLQKQGVDTQKIVLGLPTYGREMLVSSLPTPANNFTYGKKGEMAPEKIGLTRYTPDTNFSDPPNASAYYPTGGAVDNTGVYGYSCLVRAQTGGASGSNCPTPTSVPSQTDNRGLFGQPLPPDLHFTTITGSHGVDHQWGYSLTQNVVKSPAAGNKVAIPLVYYNAYPVFSYDSPDTVQQKIEHIVKARKLAGAWFWDIHSDTYLNQDAQYSLYLTAVKALGR